MFAQLRLKFGIAGLPGPRCSAALGVTLTFLPMKSNLPDTCWIEPALPKSQLTETVPGPPVFTSRPRLISSDAAPTQL